MNTTFLPFDFLFSNNVLNSANASIQSFGSGHRDEPYRLSDSPKFLSCSFLSFEASPVCLNVNLSS